MFDESEDCFDLGFEFDSEDTVEIEIDGTILEFTVDMGTSGGIRLLADVILTSDDSFAVTSTDAVVVSDANGVGDPSLTNIVVASGSASAGVTNTNFATITDFSIEDTLEAAGLTVQSAASEGSSGDAVRAITSELEPGQTITFNDHLIAALNSGTANDEGVSFFNFGGNTYLVFDNSGDDDAFFATGETNTM